MSEEPILVTFKRTQGGLETIQLAYQPAKIIEEYLNDLGQLFDVDPLDIKLVYKGKILSPKTTAEGAKISSGTVMVVANQKKQPKKSVASKDQVVPGAGISAGYGTSTMLGGVGAYQMINHPQYMSAISQAVDPQRMQQLMDDPQMQGMMEQMLEDPDTLRQMLNQNPMTRNMMKDNPMMQMVLNNPALMKMVFNKDMMKRTQEYMKNGGSLEKLQSGDPAGLQAMMGGQSGLGGFGAMQQAMAGKQGLYNMPNPNPMMSGFGGLGGQGFNPMMGGMNPLMMASLQSQMMKNMEQSRYGAQLKELELMGFKDRTKNLQILKQVNGDVDAALEKLCTD